MSQNFLECDRGQAFLLPPSLDEWLPADHFARFVIAAVEAMDLELFAGSLAPTDRVVLGQFTSRMDTETSGVLGGVAAR